VAGALYNRYRPRTFSEVVGQGHVTEALSAALRNQRLHHAYLFSGPRGCGKTSSARILAASLNCVHGPTPEPCGECDQCVAIRSGASLDVIEMDAASHNGVDDARDLRERVAFAPVSARRKVYIIDEAHMVTAAAFNALLKVVEEPPPFVTFVFATTEPERVIQTIRSRTFHYHFRLVPPRELTDHLARICRAEDTKVEPTVLPLVVRAGGGSVRDSLSVLDQLLSGAGDEGLTYRDAAALLGLTDAVLLDRVVDCLAAADGASAFALVDEVVNAGHDPRRFAQDLLERLRDLIVLAAVPDALDRDIIALPADQLERMHAQAQQMGPASLSRAADILHEGLSEMRGTTAPRLVLELVLARILLPAAASDASALLVRLERLERAGGAPAAAAPTGRPAPAAAAAAPAAPPPAAPAARAARPPVERPTPPPTPTAPEPAAPEAAAPPQPAAAPGAWPEVARPGAGGPPAAEAPRPDAPAPADDHQHSGANLQRGTVEPGPVAQEPAAQVVPQLRPAASGLDVVAVRDRWPQVLDAVKDRRRFTHAVLEQHAMVVAVNGDELVLAFSAPPMARNFTQSALNAEVLGEALQQVLGARFRITVSQQAPGDLPAGRSGEAAPRPAAGPGFAAEPDEPSVDDETTDDGTGPRGEDAALAALRQHLGATVIGEISP
jgi:DNA polymerase-3 subunit gamma/tau